MSVTYEQLAALQKQELSFAKIATAVGMTRNMVAGRLTRGPCTGTPGRKPGDKPTIPKRAVAHSAPSVPMLDAAADQCRWPMWEFGESPRNPEICGAPKTGGSYCAEHARKAYSGRAG